jgi:glucose-1-phosphate adenylyltransferase
VIQPGTLIDESIIGQGVVIGRNCRIKRAIIDAHNYIPDDTVIGEDPEADARDYSVDPGSGIVTLGMPRIQYQKDVDEKALDSFSWSTFS